MGFMKFYCAICLEEIAEVQLDELMSAKLGWDDTVDHINFPKGVCALDLPVEKPCLIAVLSCGHIFHTNCWKRWVENSHHYAPRGVGTSVDPFSSNQALPITSCPTCRRLPDYVVNQPEFLIQPMMSKALLSLFSGVRIGQDSTNIIRICFRKWMARALPDRNRILALRHELNNPADNVEFEDVGAGFPSSRVHWLTYLMIASGEIIFFYLHERR
ncbi:hypothetical protein DC094_14865 [Pelagibaculum spongiae]|uniref:RING-type domain-containing protein n=2 Tax=Pelagibaculum spongiae TaxID=2080658 RepID=A0A2V1GSM2_9GAMM|nr:hypothetical protein DC094_14865 [Pelagibaculum spongiae]